MKVAVIAIGDELLIGQVTDTNSGDIARRIASFGWSISSVQVVHDESSAIISAIDRAFSEADIVITTGGIGPTKEDITKQTLCRYFGGELVEDSATLDNVKRVVADRGLKMNELTARQAMIPSSCQVIQNQVGTAPITWWKRDNRVLVSMPGVPFETRHMLDTGVLPLLRSMFPSDEVIERRTIIIAGISESLLATKISDYEDALPDFIHLAYLPKDSVIRLRIDGLHKDGVLLKTVIDRCHRELIKIIGDYVIATEDLSPEEILLGMLKQRGLTFATAESCTGGNIAHTITSIPGSSEVFKGSIVAYANSVKADVLAVNIDDINTYGTVSQQVVEQMALGAIRLLGADVAVATSGIAGPGGGSEEKPVGTVWIAVATPNGVRSQLLHLTGSRDRVIIQTTVRALTMAINELKHNA